MTEPISDEEYVRSRWDRVMVCDGSYRYFAKGTILINWEVNSFYDFSKWVAVAEFTREREEQIRRVEEEIAALHKLCPCRHGSERCVCEELSRILAREQAALEELKCGMKGTE